MPPKALLVAGFGAALDWRAPRAEVERDALKRAYASVDGVLRLPPFEAWRDALDAVRAEGADRVRAHEEEDPRAAFARSLERAGLSKRQAKEAAAKALDRYAREIEASVRAAPDATPEVFHEIPDDVRLALVVNHADAPGLRRALDRLKLSFRFEAIAVSGEVGRRLPHPALLEHALGALDVAPSEALLVGADPARDVAPALALGMRAVLVADPRAGLRDARVAWADAPAGVRVLASLAELPALLAP